MRRFLYDTAIFVYAAGGEHRYRAPCRAIVEHAGRRELRGEASVDLMQELAHQRMRRTGDRAEAARVAEAAGALCRLHDVRASDMRFALELLRRTRRLGPRDAVFAAVALERGIDAILTTDTGFDEVDGLERIDPAHEAGVAALLS